MYFIKPARPANYIMYICDYIPNYIHYIYRTELATMA